MGKVYSKNGKAYDSIFDRLAADDAWDRQMKLQEEQNKLLEEQTRAIERQTRIKEQQEEEERELESEKINLEYDKMQHEKEMRLYKLFDNAGISKELYDKFINNLISGSKQKQKLLDERDILFSAINKDSYYDDIDADAEDELDDDIVIDNTELFTKIIPGYFKKEKKANKHSLQNIKILKDDNVNHKIVMVVYMIFAAISLIVSIIGIATNIDFLVMFLLVALVLFIMAARKLFKIIENKDYIKLEERHMFDAEEIDKTKFIKPIKKRIKELDDEYSKLISNDIEDFYNYRLNHYNSVLEKLLIDVGFDRFLGSYNIKHKMVNSKNKKKNGKIEDYIEYFTK